MQRIAGLERALEQAQHMLHQDDLTPLLNRRGFRRACDRWAVNGPMAMSTCCAMIDLDGFKAMTATAIRSATPRWFTSPPRCAGICVPPTPSRGWVATSSP